MEAIEAYRTARAQFVLASERADAAFLRWFERVQAGERTNGAAAQRLANEANYASADLASAEGKVYGLDLDPRAIDADDGVEVMPV